MSLLYQALLCLALLAGSFGAGWLKSTSYHEAKAVKAQLAQERASRVLESQASRNVIRISDALEDKTRALAATRRDVEQRLHDASATYAAANTGPVCQPDAPPVARLPDQTIRDLVQLAADANDTAARLTALQSYVSEVVKPKE
jgi:hypothetical protein